ncbi:hypothetical protein PVAP13_5KG697732 [Panicum virgatum]|uniref:Uncharacterized protein n=1 Tax=Panicum virgatum TaxID=38727 RepID=A0A8T0T2S4_PANVG|nr:hypothetical protein PVAP13_5KG697732 [Panicum virgatum]
MSFLAFIPLSASRRAAAADHAYHRMEEGAWPNQPPSPAAWRFWKLALRSFLVIMFIGMVAFLLLSRFVYHDPEFQNPFIIIFLVILLLMVVAHGFLSTRDM